MCFAPQRHAIFGHRNFQNRSRNEVFCAFWLTNALRATEACHLTIGTSKMAPTMRCYVHFDLQMCFAPQRRAIFPDRNFKNGSDNKVVRAFWLTNAFFATAACHFSGSQLQKWLRHCGVLSILTYKCASRHSGVPFFTCLLNSYLRTRRFSEATFRTSGTTNHLNFLRLLTFQRVFFRPFFLQPFQTFQRKTFICYGTVQRKTFICYGSMFCSFGGPLVLHVPRVMSSLFFFLAPFSNVQFTLSESITISVESPEALQSFLACRSLTR